MTSLQQSSIKSETPSLSSIRVTIISLPEVTRPSESYVGSFFSRGSKAKTTKEEPTVNSYAIPLPQLTFKADPDKLREAVEQSVTSILGTTNQRFRFRSNVTESASQEFLSLLPSKADMAITDVLVPQPQPSGPPTICDMDPEAERILNGLSSQRSMATQKTTIPSIASLDSTGQALDVLLLASGDGKALTKGITLGRIEELCSWVDSTLKKWDSAQRSQSADPGPVEPVELEIAYAFRDISDAFKNECIPHDEIRAANMERKKQSFERMTNDDKSNFIRWKIREAVRAIYRSAYLVEGENKTAIAKKFLINHGEGGWLRVFIPELKRWAGALKNHVEEYELKGMENDGQSG